MKNFSFSFFLNKKVIFFVILFLFVAVRLSGLDLPYHQDEQKYVARGVSLLGTGVTSGHPPLLGIIMTAAGFFFGDAFFRLMPFLFGVGSFLLLYALMRTLFDNKTALWAGFLYAISPYGVWASLMVDVDGAVLPFFAFAAFLFYVLWHQRIDRRRLYGTLLIISLVLGVLVKLSFVLVFAALAIDMAIRYWRQGNRKAVYTALAGIIVLPLLALGLIAILSLVLPSFNFSETLGHAKGYIHFSGRGYGQIAFQTFKALLYLSPLLVIPTLFVSRQILYKLRPLVLYLGLALIFYLVLFDFSSAALDKYLMVAVMPLAAASGAVLAEAQGQRLSRRWIVAGVVVAVFLIAAQAFPQAVPPLYPKGEWLTRITSLKWNFLVPFMGGSGPTGFYASWLFLVTAWIVALGAAVWGFFRKNMMSARPFVLIVGIVYSVIMLSELLFGYPHGSSKKVLDDALRYIERTPSVQSVITFNDIGGYHINKMGKYERRMYAVPKYEKLYTELLNNHYGHLLVVDIPRIYQNSVYWRYVSSCRPEFVSHSGYISATLYDCAKHAKL